MQQPATDNIDTASHGSSAGDVRLYVLEHSVTFNYT